MAVCRLMDSSPCSVRESFSSRRYFARRPASRQNCVSLRSVMRYPFSRSRLISSSFRPASLPAACSGLGRPRTTTVVFAEGALWTVAPALRAALAASLRRVRQDAGEGEMRSLERPQPSDLQRRGWMGQGVDQLPRALVPLPALTDAAIDDLLQVIGAAQAPDLAGANPGRRGSLHEHAEELPDLIDVVARLPLRGRGREEVARHSPRVQRAGVDAAPVALVPHDPEIAELQAHPVADEHVHRSQVPVEQLAPMELPEDLENPGDLAPRGLLGPPLRRCAGGRIAGRRASRARARGSRGRCRRLAPAGNVS